MLGRLEATVFKAYETTKAFSTAWGPIPKGSRWEALHFFENNDVLTSASYFNRSLGFLVDSSGTPVPDKPLIHMSVLNPDIMSRPVAGTYRFITPGCENLFKALEFGTRVSDQPVRKEVLMYAGIESNDILLKIFQYVGEMPDFNDYQLARFPLTGGDILTFNRFKIKIIKVTAKEITFETLE